MSEKLRSSHAASSVLPDKPKYPTKTNSAFVPVHSANGASSNHNRTGSRGSTPVSQVSYPGYGQPNAVVYNPQPMQFPQYPMTAQMGYPPLPGNIGMPAPSGMTGTHGVPGMSAAPGMPGGPGTPLSYYQHPMQQPQMSPYWPSYQTTSQQAYPMANQSYYQNNSYPSPQVNHQSTSGFEPMNSSTLNRPPSGKSKTGTNSDLPSPVTNSGAGNPGPEAGEKHGVNETSSRGHTPLINPPIASQFSTPYNAYNNMHGNFGQPQQYPAQPMNYNPYMPAPSPYYPGYDMGTMQMYDQWYKMYANAMRNMYYPYMKKREKRSDRETTSVTRDSVYSPTESSVVGANDDEVQSRVDNYVSPSVVTNASDSGRKTPERFPGLHSIAKFSPNGAFLFTDLQSGGKSHLYLHTFSVSSSTGFPEALETFPGPLYGQSWKAPKSEVKRYLSNRLKECRKMMRSFEPTDFFAQLGDVFDFMILLKYLLLLVDNDGALDEISICDILTEDLDENDKLDFDSPKSISLSDLNETALTSPCDDKRAEIMTKLTKMLLRGESKKFVELAVQEKLWGIALRFSQVMCPSLFNKVCIQFDQANVAINDPLKTYISVKTCKDLHFVENEALSVNWKQHLAIILSNCVNEEKMFEYCMSLSDVLSGLRRPYASQLCNLLAKLDFDWPSYKVPKNLVLIGLPMEKSLAASVGKNFLPMTLTMIYEHAIKQSFPSFTIPYLQVCKLTLARKYLDCGKFETAFKYCENISVNLLVNANIVGLAFIVQLTELSFMLALKLSKTRDEWFKSLLELYRKITGMTLDVSQGENEVQKVAGNSLTNVGKTAAYSTIESDSNIPERKSSSSLQYPRLQPVADPINYNKVNGKVQQQQENHNLKLHDSSKPRSEQNSISNKFPGPKVPEDEIAATSVRPSFDHFEQYPSNTEQTFDPNTKRNSSNQFAGPSFDMNRNQMSDEVQMANLQRQTSRLSLGSTASSHTNNPLGRLGSKGSVTEQNDGMNNSFQGPPPPPSEPPFGNSNIFLEGIPSMNQNDFNYESQNPAANFSSSYPSNVNSNFYQEDTASTNYSSRGYLEEANLRRNSGAHSQFDYDDEESEEESSDNQDEREEDDGLVTTHSSSGWSSEVRSSSTFVGSGNQASTYNHQTSGFSSSPRYETAPNQMQGGNLTSHSAVISSSNSQKEPQESAPPPPFSLSYTQNAMPPSQPAAPNPFSRSGLSGNRSSQYQQYPNAFKVAEASKILPPPAMPTPHHMYEPTSAGAETQPQMPQYREPQQGDWNTENRYAQESNQHASKENVQNIGYQTGLRGFEPPFSNGNQNVSNSNQSDVMSIGQEKSYGAPPIAESNDESEPPVMPTFFNPAKFKSVASMGPPVFPSITSGKGAKN